MEDQRELICKFIEETYGVEAEYLWERFPDYSVYRNPVSKKWFALVATVPKNKLGLDETSEGLPVINLKCDSMMSGSLRLEKGILPAYHMNKNSWISVLLDGTVDFEKIKMLIDISYDNVRPKIKKKKIP